MPSEGARKFTVLDIMALVAAAAVSASAGAAEGPLVRAASPPLGRLGAGITALTFVVEWETSRLGYGRNPLYTHYLMMRSVGLVGPSVASACNS